jgi:mRNA interferase RelE/StbE
MPSPTRGRTARTWPCRLMPYDLKCKVEALREWEKLGATVLAQFKNKLAERLGNPHIPTARLHGAENCYKIKLAGASFWLVYEARDGEHVVVVIAVGKRERGKVHAKAARQLKYEE